MNEEELQEAFDSLTEEELEVLSEEMGVPLEELSKKTLGSYIQKARDDYGNKTYGIANERKKQDKLSHLTNTNDYSSDEKKTLTKARDEMVDSSRKSEGKLIKKAHQRSKGIDRAVKRLTKESIENDIAEENLEELSKKTLGSYIKKSSTDAAQNAFDAADPIKKKTGKELGKTFKRLRGIEKATKRLTKEENDITEENLEELSKATLGSYIKKARGDSDIHKTLSKKYADQADDDRRVGEYDEWKSKNRKSSKHNVKHYNREKGINKALKKLTKEENENNMEESYQDRDQPAVETKDSTEKVVPGNKQSKSTDNYKIDGMEPEKVVPGARLAKDTATPYLKKTATLAKESVQSMFDGVEGLSEDFFKKAETIFESVVNEVVLDVVEGVTAELEESFAQEYDALEEQLTEKIDDYMNYVVENWLEENELQVTNGIKQQIFENFVSDFKDLLESYNIVMDDESIDLYESAVQENEELVTEYNELMEDALEMAQTIFEYQKADVLGELTEGLSETQIEKFKTLVESVEAKDIDTFTEKAQILRESAFNKTKAALNEDTVETDTPVVDELQEDTAGDKKKKTSSISSYVTHAKTYNKR